MDPVTAVDLARHDRAVAQETSFARVSYLVLVDAYQRAVEVVAVAVEPVGAGAAGLGGVGEAGVLLDQVLGGGPAGVVAAAWSGGLELLGAAAPVRRGGALTDIGGPIS